MLEPLQVSNELLSVLTGPLSKDGHVVVPCQQPLSLEEKKKRVREADILLIANSPLTGEILDEARQLKYISVAFTGTDHVDKGACAERGIKISNASGYATRDVAELAVAMMIGLLRDVRKADARVRAGGAREGLAARRLSGQTVGILGTGPSAWKWRGCRRPLAAGSSPQPQLAPGGPDPPSYVSLRPSWPGATS